MGILPPVLKKSWKHEHGSWDYAVVHNPGTPILVEHFFRGPRNKDDIVLVFILGPPHVLKNAWANRAPQGLDICKGGWGIWIFVAHSLLNTLFLITILSPSQ